MVVGDLPNLNSTVAVFGAGRVFGAVDGRSKRVSDEIDDAVAGPPYDNYEF